MKNNLFLIGILVTALALSNAIAMGSSTDSGLDMSSFTTDSKIYVTHGVSIVCSDVVISGELQVYIVPDKEWTLGEDITDFVVNTTVTTSSAGKLPASLIWATPEVGSYDIIIDMNKDGKYDAGFECEDLLDDNTAAGFTVTEATAPIEENVTNATSDATANETVNETVNESTEEVIQEPIPTLYTSEPNATVPESNEPVTKSSGMDYVPFVIIAAAIVIAGLIIAVTLRRMH